MLRQGILIGTMIAGMFLISCGAEVSTVTPPPTLPQDVQQNQRAIEANQTAQAEYVKMLDAQRAATVAAAEAQKASAMVTAAAMATRDALGMQATRQALSAQATQQVQNAAATATVQSAQTTATVQAAQYTATAYAVVVEATQVSASATATANAANARATQVSANATATVTMAQVMTAQEKAEWDKRLEAGRAIATFVLVILGIIAVVLFLGWGALKVIDAVILRVRVIRDAHGVPFVVLPPDRAGRQTLLAPTRQPGAVTLLTPPNEEPLQIETGAVDADTTKRDQAVSLMMATHSRHSGETARELLQEPRIRIVEAPPQQLVSPEAQQAIEAEWKLVNRDQEAEVRDQ